MAVALLSACAQAQARAQALFAERCKMAGVVIHRSVKDVEGIQLLKLRPELEFAERRYFDPMWEEVGLAVELSGEDFFKQFLMSEFRQKNEPEKRGRMGPPEFEPGPHLLPGIRGYLSPGLRNRMNEVQANVRDVFRAVGEFIDGTVAENDPFAVPNAQFKD